MTKSTQSSQFSLGVISILLIPGMLWAQVPVDEDGNEIGSYESQPDVVSAPRASDGDLNAAELEELVGPVALYPDDLLAIVTIPQGVRLEPHFCFGS